VTRVLVNLTWLVPGVVGGSEESTTQSLRALAEVLDATDGHGLDVHLAVLEPFPAAHPDLVERFPVRVAPLSGASRVRRVLSDQTWLASQARRIAADVVHHAGGVVPLRHPGRSVLTVHDLQPLDLPGNFSLVKRTYLRMMTARSLRAASVVVVPSEFTASRVRHHGLPGSTPLRVVPWAAPDPPVAPAAADLRVPGEVAGHPVVLYPAVPYAHKEHLLLLDAFAGVLARRPGVRLVLTGGPGPLEDAVHARAERPDLAGRVLRTGRVSTAELEALYRSAALVVVPSSYEGFGLPVLEAMRRRVRVLAADAGSLPEVARPGDLVRRPGVSGWTAAMLDVLDEDPTERLAALDAAGERAAAFSPARTGRGLLDAYLQAAAAPPDGRVVDP